MDEEKVAEELEDHNDVQVYIHNNYKIEVLIEEVDYLKRRSKKFCKIFVNSDRLRITKISS